MRLAIKSAIQSIQNGRSISFKSNILHLNLISNISRDTQTLYIWLVHVAIFSLSAVIICHFLFRYMRSVCLCVSVYRLSVCSHFLKRVPHIWWTKRIIEKSIFSQWNTFHMEESEKWNNIRHWVKVKAEESWNFEAPSSRLLVIYLSSIVYRCLHCFVSFSFFIVNFKRERKYELSIFSLGQRGQHPLRYFSVYWINSILDYFLSIQFHQILVGANDFMMHDWLWSLFDVFYLAIDCQIRTSQSSDDLWSWRWTDWLIVIEKLCACVCVNKRK